MVRMLVRIAGIVKSRVQAGLDTAADPCEILELSYDRQVDRLARVRWGIADVAQEKSRVQLQLHALRKAAEPGDGTPEPDQSPKVEGLQTQIDALETQLQQLRAGEQLLAGKIEAFRSHKDAMKARYDFARARVRVAAMLEAIEGATAVLGWSQKQVAAPLRRVRSGLGTMEMAASRLNLELMRLQQDAVTYDRQAQQARAANRQDLAHLATTRKAELTRRLHDLESVQGTLETQLQQLRNRERRLAATVAAPPGHNQAGQDTTT